jgi:preprotein translocase subunit SecD
MGPRNILKVLILIILVAVAAVYYVVPAAKSMNLGLDLKGGVYVVMEAIEGDREITNQDMVQLVEVIRKRVDKLGVAEPVIQRQGSDRIIVELPAVESAESALQIIGQTAKLQFADETGQILLDGKDLKNALAAMDNNTNQSVVQLTFSKEGKDKFASATSNNVGKPIYILLDENVISAPTVREPILDGSAQIDGMESPEAAQELSILLNSGALPVDIEILETRTVGPQLGKESIDASIKAALLGLLLVALYMIIFYRLPGFVAVLSLGVYVVILLGVFAGINATLTLPGIAGLILSVGMAVDANVIIFERLKDELRHGKTLRSALDAGFKRAMLTIFDSNITTLIAAAVLFYFASGPVKGFAVTLSIGVVTSLFTAIIVTKFILKALIMSGYFRNKVLYGFKDKVAAAVEGDAQ